MIKAGELGGILDTILERLTAYMESSEALKAKVKSAMMYPAIVLSICAIVTCLPDGLRDPDLQEHLRQLRRGAAAADADPDRHLRLR